MAYRCIPWRKTSVGSAAERRKPLWPAFGAPSGFFVRRAGGASTRLLTCLARWRARWMRRARLPPALAPASRGRMRMRTELRAGTVGGQLAARRVARRSVLQGAAVLAGGLLAGCGTRGGPAAPAPTTRAPATVRMACWSSPLAEQSNVFAAQEFGWFAEQGLDFEFVPGAGGGDAIKHI